MSSLVAPHPRANSYPPASQLRYVICGSAYIALLWLYLAIMSYVLSSIMTHASNHDVHQKCYVERNITDPSTHWHINITFTGTGITITHSLQRCATGGVTRVVAASGAFRVRGVRQIRDVISPPMRDCAWSVQVWTPPMSVCPRVAHTHTHTHTHPLTTFGHG